VRKADGRVPRQKARMELGDEEISRMVRRSELEPLCWTRVFRRSAGWRRTAERMPDPRPAMKWNAISKCNYYLKWEGRRRRLNSQVDDFPVWVSFDISPCVRVAFLCCKLS